jgi:hypothetical protein
MEGSFYINAVVTREILFVRRIQSDGGCTTIETG